MVDNGGCSGFQYVFRLESEDTYDKENDIKIGPDQANVIIDKISIPFLEGSKIDYKETLIRAGFTVIENKTAEQSCSCGVSFTPKINTQL